MSDNKNTPGEKFSDDPEENLRLENEFLQMKLSAETGAIFGGDASGLPPEIMNEWLKNVAAFEKNYAEGKEVLIRELLGNPEFQNEELLGDEAFEDAFKRLTNILEEKNILVNFARERDDRFKYKFITEELMGHATTLLPDSGMVANFIYEEFHPDHELDIEGKTRDFFEAFFERKLGDAGKYFFSEEHVMPDGKVILREEVLQRFESLYEAVPEFQNTFYEIEKIDFELKEDEAGEITGFGFSEGIVKYDMIFADGAKKIIDGPFKIYFAMQWDWWNIYFLYLAGYNLTSGKSKED